MLSCVALQVSLPLVARLWPTTPPHYESRTTDLDLFRSLKMHLQEPSLRGPLDPFAANTARLASGGLPVGIRSGQRLRAVTKWVAVAGSAATSLLNPYLAAVAGLATGFFLLVDP